MKQSLRRLALFACLTGLGGLSACVSKNLHDTFGLRYNGFFNAQAAERQTREPSPVRGDEASRAIQAYYETLGPKENGADSSSNTTTPFNSRPSGMVAPPTLHAR